MADVNSVVLVGRLTRDGELRMLPNGTAVCRLSIAVNRKVKKQDQWVDDASFFEVSLWGKQAEVLHKYLTKGRQVAVQGELRQDRWESNGEKRSKVEIHANYVQLLGGGDRNGGGPSAPSTSSSSYEAPPAPQHDDFEEDVPF